MLLPPRRSRGRDLRRKRSAPEFWRERLSFESSHLDPERSGCSNVEKSWTSKYRAAMSGRPWSKSVNQSLSRATSLPGLRIRSEATCAGDGARWSRRSFLVCPGRTEVFRSRGAKACDEVGYHSAATLVSLLLNLSPELCGVVTSLRPTLFQMLSKAIKTTGDVGGLPFRETHPIEENGEWSCVPCPASD